MKNLKTFDQMFEAYNQKSGRFSVLPNGNLEITLEGTDADDLAEMKEFEGSDDNFLWDFFEQELTNGFFLVPENHKGLTEAPMISDEVINDETTKKQMKDASVWAFMDYQVKSVKDVLLKDGKIVFNKA